METQLQPEEPERELPPDAGVVCHGCVAVNPPFTNYCEECGAPLNQFVTFNSFDQTLVEGFAYRRAAEGPPSKMVLAGIWVLFGPSLLYLPAILLGASKERSRLAADDFSEGMVGWLLFLVYAIACNALVYRATVNYLRKRRQAD